MASEVFTPKYHISIVIPLVSLKSRFKSPFLYKSTYKLNAQEIEKSERSLTPFLGFHSI